MKFVPPFALVDANLVSSSATEAHAEWSAGTTYALNDRVIRAAAHKIYECIQGPSTGNTPETSPLYWTDKGPTNTWAMFDTQISTQTTAPTNLTVVLKPGLCNSVCAYGLVGNTITVTVRDGLAGPVVYTATKTLDGTIITDWYQYYFEPAVQMASANFTDLPPYTNAHITVTITGVGTVKCGTLMLGTFYELGQVLYGAGTGIIDFSKKTTDTAGVHTYVQGAYSDRITVTLKVPDAQKNKVRSLLTAHRGPCAWIALDVPGYEVLDTMGWFRDFNLDIQYSSYSQCSLEIEGFT